MPTLPPNLGMAELKELMNTQREQAAAEGMKVLGSQVLTHDHSIPSRDGSHVEVRSYRPANVDADKVLPVYVYLHGGGMFFGTLSADDAICAQIAAKAQVVVLNVNYRHTPEHIYPVAWDDVGDAFEWLHDHINTIGGDAQQVVIGGISAGALLAASFMLQKHMGQVSTSLPTPAGQVLMIPWLVHPDCYEVQLRKLKDPLVSSYEQNKDAAILPMSVAQFFAYQLKVEDPRPDDLKLNPGNAKPEDVAGLPPTVVSVTGWDILRDEGLLWAQTLTEAG
jgi:acetyl esterase/lipase